MAVARYPVASNRCLYRGQPYEAARARLELAAVLISLDRTERARDEARLAREAFEMLGASFSAARARLLLEDIDRREGLDGSGLTPHQIEILRLVSQGLNDRQIASALAISEHTVHRHVANVLMRLNVPTRAAAAAHAASRGLI